MNKTHLGFAVVIVLLIFMGVCYYLSKPIARHIVDKIESAGTNEFELVEITIDEIPPSDVVRAILFYSSGHKLDFRLSSRSKSLPDLYAVKFVDFSVIGDPNEVREIIGRNIPSAWVIGSPDDVKKITNDFRNATRCRSRAACILTDVLWLLSIPLQPIRNTLYKDFRYVYLPSAAWEYYIAGHQMVMTGFTEQWAIFITKSRGYALKFGTEEGPPIRVFGPDYYSSRLGKYLMSLYKKANKHF